MRIRTIAVLAALQLLAAPPRALAAPLPPAPEISSACQALQRADFTGVPDAPTRIYASKVVAAAGDVPAYCHVTGYVAPQVAFDLKLPLAAWNGGLLGIGCGGMCGDVERFFHRLTRWLAPLQRGYATVGTDMGHRGVDSQDALWALGNLPGRIDFFHRATHVTTLAAKAIVARFYGQPVQRAYFWGNSTGGRQAMMEVQKYPEDYDGVVARCPAIDPMVAVQLTFFTNELSRAFTSHADNDAKIRLLAAEVKRQCDRLDGLADGVIADPPACRVDLRPLRCAPGQAGAQCLADTEIAAVEAVYRGPRDSKGAPVAGGLMPGSEADWIGRYLTVDGSDSFYYAFMRDWWRYLAFETPEPGFEPRDLVIDRDVPRLGWQRAMHSATDPDLRRFRDRGGKILMLQGWGDTSVIPGRTVDYYETVTRTMGGPQATGEFFRLFMLPGVGHCDHGGLTGADVVDDLAALEAWAEQGEAPQSLVAWRLKQYAGGGFAPQKTPPDADNVAFSRRLYPYPAVGVYDGRGDPARAESFVPREALRRRAAAPR